MPSACIDPHFYLIHSIQTCLTVQLPKWFGGLAGQAIFIDTEGNFIPRRVEQMAEALVAHCRKHLTFEGKVFI